jgi:hypothetical protein
VEQVSFIVTQKVTTILFYIVDQGGLGYYVHYMHRDQILCLLAVSREINRRLRTQVASAERLLEIKKPKKNENAKRNVPPYDSTYCVLALKETLWVKGMIPHRFEIKPLSRARQLCMCMNG